MAKKKITNKQLREHTVDELALRREDVRKEMFTLRVRATTKELDNVNEIRAKRREIARINTILGEKSREAAG